MVEPAVCPGNNQQAVRRECECCLEGELEIGRVLVLRVSFDSRPRPLKRGEGFWVY